MQGQLLEECIYALENADISYGQTSFIASKSLKISTTAEEETVPIRFPKDKTMQFIQAA